MMQYSKSVRGEERGLLFRQQLLATHLRFFNQGVGQLMKMMKPYMGPEAGSYTPESDLFLLLLLLTMWRSVP